MNTKADCILQMKQRMPLWMVNSRFQIIKLLNSGKNISEISEITGHGRMLIRKIKKQLELGINVFELENTIGAPKKRTPALEAEVIRLTVLDRRGASIE